MKFTDIVNEATTEEKIQIKRMRDLNIELGEAGISIRDVASPKSVPKDSGMYNLRINDSFEKLTTTLDELGYVYDPILPNGVTGKFQGVSIKDSLGKFKPMYVVATLKSGDSVVSKILTPSKMGLDNKTVNKTELAKILLKFAADIDNSALSNILQALTNAAVNDEYSIDEKYLKDFTDGDRIRVGVDFGEVLVPLFLAKSDNDRLFFPSGNAPLADVHINDLPISVKSGAGSGTSFKSINDFLTKFNEKHKEKDGLLEPEEEHIFEFYMAFLTPNATNVDKIILASNKLQNDTHIKMTEVIGKDDFNFNDLIAFSESINSYEEFLEKIYPIATALNPNKPNGLPQDYKYYMGVDGSKLPKIGKTGKIAWDLEQGKAGANIMTYILGTGFLSVAQNNRDLYSGIIGKILKNLDAKMVKIDLLKDGTITLIEKDFSTISFKFQYHAPSHKAGNNLPGFKQL